MTDNELTIEAREDILEELKFEADLWDNRDNQEMSVFFIRCIGEIRKLRGALEAVKERVCGEAMPHWENTPRTGVSRGWIADVCDSALPPNEPEQE